MPQVGKELDIRVSSLPLIGCVFRNLLWLPTLFFFFFFLVINVCYLPSVRYLLAFSPGIFIKYLVIIWSPELMVSGLYPHQNLNQSITIVDCFNILEECLGAQCGSLENTSVMHMFKHVFIEY